jgi:hypothetical protein
MSKWIFHPWVVIYTWPNYEDNSHALSRSSAQRDLRVYIISEKPFSKVPIFWQLDQTRVKSIWKFNPASLFLFYLASATFSSHGGRITLLTEISRRVNVWHGIPIKKVGRIRGDNPPTPSGLALSTSPKGTELMRTMYDERAPQFLETGFPRNDLITKNAKMKSKIRRLVYVPTYRKSAKGMVHSDGLLLQNGLCLSDGELQELDKFLNAKEIFLDIVAHPMAKVILPDDLRNISIVVRDNSESSLYSELGKYDALISDYSSVIIDFLLSNKPIIVFTPDKLEYQETRGLNLEISEIPATFFADNITTLEKSINKVYQEKTRKVLVEGWHTYRDSNSSSRLLDYLFQGTDGEIPKKLRSMTRNLDLVQATLLSALSGLLFPVAILLTQENRVFAEFWLIFSMMVFIQSLYRVHCENFVTFNKKDSEFKASTTSIGVGIGVFYAYLCFFALNKIQENNTWRTFLALALISLSLYQTELIRSEFIAKNALREAKIIAQFGTGMHVFMILTYVAVSSIFNLDFESLIFFYTTAILSHALISKKVRANMTSNWQLVKQNPQSIVHETSNWFLSLYALLATTLGNVIVNYLLVFHNLESSLVIVRGAQIVFTPIVYLSTLQIWTYEIKSGFNEFLNRRLLFLASILGFPLYALALLVHYKSISTTTLLCILFIFGEVCINLRSNFFQLSIRASGELLKLGNSRTILALTQVTIIFCLILINGLSALTFSCVLLIIGILNYALLKKSFNGF